LFLDGQQLLEIGGEKFGQTKLGTVDYSLLPILPNLIKGELIGAELLIGDSEGLERRLRIKDMCWVPGTDMDNFVDFVDDLDV
jgi:hypothetical protein